MSFIDDTEDLSGDEESSAEGDPNVVSHSPASTCIANLTYHRDTGELFMTFMDGRRYVIPSFPEIELERWVQSPSIGGYFNSFVRGNY